MTALDIHSASYATVFLARSGNKGNIHISQWPGVRCQIKTLPWVDCFYIGQLFRWNKVGSPHYEGYQKASTKLTSPKAVAKLTPTCHKIFSSFSFSVFFSSADQIFLSQNIFFPFNFLALFTSKDQIFVLCTNLTPFPSPNSISSAHQIFSKYLNFLEDEAEYT